jgi:N-acetyl sugar amidotransferase
MDTSDPDITFDEQGICNYCTEFLEQSSHILNKDSGQRQRERETFLTKVMKRSEGKPYDCIIGVSGGVDSSTALVNAVKLGLRPLAVHMDNGWDSELAQNNIANLVRGLGVDLYTHVIDWEEYRSLMQAFFDADVIDIELLYDNAMLAVNYQQAARHRLQYILAGYNATTEGMRIPATWNWFKYDKRNIQTLADQFGGVKLDTFPAIGTYDYIWFSRIRGIRMIPFLDYFEYDKYASLAMLQRDYGYKPYPYKHYESIFTRFYQGYILPQKFGVDKRRLHLSTLVISGQLPRAEALRQLADIPYPSKMALDEDKQYFMKKMHWTPQQLEEYIKRPGKPHTAYPSEKALWDTLFRFYMKNSRKR